MAEHAIDHEKLYREETRKECERIVKLINPGSKTTVRWVPKAGWSWNFKEDFITMDEHDLQTKSREYCKSVALHEAMHVWMSRVEHFTDEEWGQLGFGLGFNWVEDCGIENASDRAIIHGKQIIKAHLEVETRSGGGLDIEINKIIDKKLGYVPKHMILGAVMRNYFYQRQITGNLNVGNTVDTPIGIDDVVFSQIDITAFQAFIDKIEQIDSDVNAAFKDIRPLLEQFWNDIPNFAASEPEIQAWAKKRADTYRKIWEHYKTLVEQSVDDHALKKFIDEIVKGGSFQGEGAGGFIIIDFDSLPPQIQQEIKEKMGQGAPQPGMAGESGAGGGAGSQQPEGGEAGDTPQPGGQPSGEKQEGAPGETGRASGQGSSSAPSGSPKNEASSSDGSNQVESPSSDAGTGSPGESSDSSEGVPWNQLSEEAKQAAKEAFAKVDEKEKQKIKDKATEELAETEDAINEELEGHTDKESVTRPTKLKEKAQQNSQSKNPPQPGQDSPSGSDSDSQGDSDGGDSDSSDSSGSGSGSSSSAQSSSTQGGKGEASSDDKDTKSQSGSDPHDIPPTPYQRPLIPPAPPITEQEEREVEEFFKDYQPPKARERKLNRDSTYQEFRAQESVDAAITAVYEPLFEVFRPKSKRKKSYGDSGDDLDDERYQEFRAGERVDADYMSSESSPQQTAYRVSVLFDRSGSMRDKEVEVHKMAVIFADLFARLGVEFQEEGYTDYPDGRAVQIYKGYDQTEGFDAALTPDMMALIDQMFQEGGGGTPTSQALSESYALLKQRHEETQGEGKRKNFMIMITDGSPGDSYGGMDGVTSAANTVRYIYQKSKEDNLNAIPIGFGIGPGTEGVNNIYPLLPFGLRVEIANFLNQKYATQKYLPEEIGLSYNRAEQLTELLPIILKYVIDNPQEFADAYEGKK